MKLSDSDFHARSSEGAFLRVAIFVGVLFIIGASTGSARAQQQENAVPMVDKFPWLKKEQPEVLMFRVFFDYSCLLLQEGQIGTSGRAEAVAELVNSKFRRSRISVPERTEDMVSGELELMIDISCFTVPRDNRELFAVTGDWVIPDCLPGRVAFSRQCHPRVPSYRSWDIGELPELNSAVSRVVDLALDHYLEVNFSISKN